MLVFVEMHDQKSIFIACETIYICIMIAITWQNQQNNTCTVIDVVVVVLGFYVLPTAKVIRRRDLGFKSHPKDWRSLGSNPRPLVYKASGLTTTLWRLLHSD